MSEKFQRVCVIGLGYVGLPTAAILATRGVDVIGVDLNATRVATINSGAAPIVEPDLDVMVRGAVATGKLHAQLAPAAADAFIIAVPTPFKDDHVPDLSYLRAAADSLAPVLAPGNLVILESTSPVGTTEALCQWLAVARPDLSFPHTDGEQSEVRVAYSPERVLPGQILIELVRNDRVVGGITPACSELAALLYRLFLHGTCHITTAATAELVKLTENAYRDVNIAFANELSLVCDTLDIDPWKMIELANQHPRVNILQPGPGVGGHCIAVDPWFIVNSVPEATPLIRTARTVNDDKPNWVIQQTLNATAGLEKPVIACLGLAYKADIDDLRESPAVDIVHQLRRQFEGRLMVVEPHISELPDILVGAGEIELVPLNSAVESADILLLLTDHRAFRDLDVDSLAHLKLIDTRGAWRKKD